MTGALTLVGMAALLVPAELIIGGFNGVSLIGSGLAVAGVILAMREGA